MRFRKVHYGNTETNEININVSKRVEYFLHYWNFVFQKNTGLLFIHHEKFESHRSLLKKLKLQLTNNPKKCRDRILKYFKVHDFFDKDNILIDEMSQKEIKKFFHEFADNWNCKDKSNEKRNRETICKQLENISDSILGEYLSRLLNALTIQLSTDKPVNKTFKRDIQFLINAVIVELYHNGFSLDYIRNLADIIVFPREHEGQFPYNKIFHDFADKESFDNYKRKISENINLHEQISCIKNLIDNNKYPKQKGYCVFKIDDFDFQLENPTEIWDVTFYNPQKTRQVKTNVPENENIEIYFNHLVFPEPNNLTNSTCNAIIKVDYRVFDWNNPVIAINQEIRKVDKALQVLKKLKLDFVNGNGSISGRVSTKNCIFTNTEYNYPNFVNIQTDHYPFKTEEDQKSVLSNVIKDIHKIQKYPKLMDIKAYLCQAKTDEFIFNFKDYWTVLAEANFPNDRDGFIDECKNIFRNELPDRLFFDTRIFLNNSLCRRSLNWQGVEYFIKTSISRQTGLNIPEKNSFNAEKFKLNYHKLKKHTEFEFLKDILEELNECMSKPEKIKNKTEEWLENTILSIYAERNLESHNNIATDYSLIKLKDEFLYIGEIFLLSKIKEPKKSKKPHNI